MEIYISSVDAQWCIGCFVCATYNQPFVDGNFFEHEGAPYCEMNFHALKGSLCAGCSKPISGKVVRMIKEIGKEGVILSDSLKMKIKAIKTRGWNVVIKTIKSSGKESPIRIHVVW